MLARAVVNVHEGGPARLEVEHYAQSCRHTRQVHVAELAKPLLQASLGDSQHLLALREGG